MGRMWTAQRDVLRLQVWKIVGFILIFLPAVCLPYTWADEPTPEFLIRKVLNTYRALDTYKVTGQTTLERTDFDEGGRVSTVTVRFSITLKKPNLYRITWEEDNPPYWFNSQGAAWNTGSQPYLYGQSLEGYMKVPTDRGALRTVYNVSKGATYLLPQLFFPFLSPDSTRLEGLENARITGIEDVKGEPCYVLTGGWDGLAVTYWISVERYLVLQYVHVVDPPNGSKSATEITEEGMEQSFQSMGVEPTVARKQEWKRALNILSKHTSTRYGQTIHTHDFSDVSLARITPQDLMFVVPEGVPLKENIYELPKKLLDKAEDRLEAIKE